MSYSEAVDEYMDAAAELGRLLDDLPKAVKHSLWHGWPHGFVKPGPANLWTNAVFELAWQKHPASRLKAERWAWHKNTKIKCSDLPQLRADHSSVAEMFGELIEHVGDPPAFWYSWIGNVWRASINAIDLLVPMLRTSQANTVDDIGKPEAVPPEQTKPKRSTVKGEARDKIIAALTKHHKYSDNSCLNTDPSQVETPAENSSKITKAGAIADNANAKPEAVTPVTDRNAILVSCTDAPCKAFFSFEYAERRNEKQMEDRPAYDWLKENGYDDAQGLTDYQLPTFDTWSRYVREVRSKLGEQKNLPRAGRATGGSVVRAKDL